MVIRVLVAGDDPLARMGIESVLAGAEDCDMVGAVSERDALVEAVARLSPDVVVLDVSFRRADPELIPGLARDHPDTRVVVRVDHSEEECALRHLLTQADGASLSREAIEVLDECCLTSLRQRAWGCLARNAGEEAVLEAVRAVARGEIGAAPWLRAYVRADPSAPLTFRPAAPHITARELEVMALVAEGLGNKEVAQRLSIREQTVKNHLARVMEKLGLRNRVEVALYASRRHFAVRHEERAAEGE